MESLASAEVVCIDKTGTLTEPSCASRAHPAAGATAGRTAARARALRRQLGRRNGDDRGDRGRVSGARRAAGRERAVLIRWKWSALSSATAATCSGRPSCSSSARSTRRAAQEPAAGRRVVAFATADARSAGVDPARRGPPAELRACSGSSTLAEELRPNIRETVGYFSDRTSSSRCSPGDSPVTRSPRSPPTSASRRQGRRSTAATLPATSRGAAERPRPDLGHRAHLAGGQEADRRGAARRGPLRRRCSATASTTCRRSRPLGSRSRRAAASQMARTVSDLVLVEGRLRAVPRLVARGPPDPPQHAARLEALHDQVPVRGADDPDARDWRRSTYPFLPRHLSLASFFTPASRRSSWPSRRARARGA